MTSRPSSVAEVIRLTSRHGKRAVFVSGLDASDKVPNGRVPIDVSGVAALNELSAKGGKVVLGTGVHFGRLLREVTGENGLLRQTVSMLGNPLMRNRITLLSALDPESAFFDFTTPLVLLDAKVRMLTATGRKTLSIRDFLEAATKGLKKGEIPAAIEFAILDKADRVGFFRVARVGRKGTVSAAARMRLKRNVCLNPEIVVSGSTLIPLRTQQAEKQIANLALHENGVQRAAAAAATEILEEMGSDDSYERTLIEIAVGRTLRSVVLGERPVTA